MIEQHFLREQNYQLKNQITDLKNAFDLNRDILKILHNYNSKSDPHFNLLMQIITRLTSVNNQAMLNNIQLIHQKNVLKQENLKLNLQIQQLQNRIQKEVQLNFNSNQPTQSKMMMQDQFNLLNKELMAANQERIIKEQEISYWKNKCQHFQREGYQKNGVLKKMSSQQGDKIKRKYISNGQFKYEVLYNEVMKQNRKLKQNVQQLQNRLLIFIKAYNLDQQSLNCMQQPQIPFFQTQRQEIRLLKYALNDIHIQKQQNQWTLTITQRFKPKEVYNQPYKEKRSYSWPKNYGQQEDRSKKKKQIQEKEERFMEDQRERERERNRY